MRKLLILVTAVTLGYGVLSIALAEETKPATTPNEQKVETKVDLAALASLRAERHRAIADLIEAQAAEKPDAAKIDALVQKIRTLRENIRSQRIACSCEACPLAGKCSCCARCGEGCWGYGRFSAGCAVGLGPGMGMGRGHGRGMGAGCAVGASCGCGVGACFVDKNNNGVCDYREATGGNRP